MNDRAFRADDYYFEDNSIRGTAVYDTTLAERLAIPSMTISAKDRSFFPSSCRAPPLPSDPLYVLPNSRLNVIATSSGELGSSIVDSVYALAPPNSRITVDESRMKITVMTPGGSDFKIKLFESSNSNHYHVIFRKDRGDCFAFYSLFVAVRKQLGLNGYQVY